MSSLIYFYFRHIKVLNPKVSSFSRLPVTSISAFSSFSFIEHLLVVYGLVQDRTASNVCCATSMYDIQNRCIPCEIELCYFKICIKHLCIDVRYFVRKKPHSSVAPRLTCPKVKSFTHYAQVVYYYAYA